MPESTSQPNDLIAKYEESNRDRRSLVFLANQCVDASAFYDAVSLSGYHKGLLAELLDTSEKTISRYKRENKKLNPAKSELVLKIIALFKKGIEVYGSVTSFKRWLEKPAYGLGGQVPFQLMHTSGGIDLVHEEVGRIEYGDLA